MSDRGGDLRGRPLSEGAAPQRREVEELRATVKAQSENIEKLMEMMGGLGSLVQRSLQPAGDQATGVQAQAASAAQAPAAPTGARQEEVLPAAPEQWESFALVMVARELQRRIFAPIKLVLCLWRLVPPWISLTDVDKLEASASPVSP